MNLKEIIVSLKLCYEQTAVFYTGQVGFIFKYNNKYILIDGYLSDYVDKNCCSENVKWVRKYDAPIKPEELDFIDYVFCTHAHYDHTDPITIKGILGVNNKAVFIAPKAIEETIFSYGVPSERFIPAIADKEYTLDGFTFTPIPSAHEELHIDKNGNYEEMGYIFNLGDTKIYHSGDCCLYDGLYERIKDCNVLMLPINGRDYYRNKNDIIGCFDSVEAITLAKECGNNLLIPMHFDLYSVNEVNPAYFADCLFKLNPTQRFHIFMPGEKYII